MHQVPSSSPAAAPNSHRILTPFQERTLLALDDSSLGATHVNDGPASSNIGIWRVAVFAVGVLCIAAGFTLIFFLTALGAGLSLLGVVTCLMAYERGTVGSEIVSDSLDEGPDAHLENASVH